MVDLLCGLGRAAIRSVPSRTVWPKTTGTGWRRLTAELGSRVQLVGDDLFTTNLERLERGIAQGCGQCRVGEDESDRHADRDIRRRSTGAREAGFRAVISARSGETEDSFLADLAVASGAGQIKVGSITRSERLAKYNRLLEIERWGGLEYSGPQFAP